MGPVNIIRVAKEKQLDIIAVTDHNHTGHSTLLAKLGAREGIWVVYGVEVTTSEDVHCLAYFENPEDMNDFQAYIDEHLPDIENDPDLFGRQILVDEQEHILEEISRSLYPGIRSGITEVASRVAELNGLFVPAHVDRGMNGLYSQLGLFPKGLHPDAVEIAKATSRAEAVRLHPELVEYQLLTNSDAHVPGHIGRRWNNLIMEGRDFSELKMALRGQDGRKVEQL
jgi:PHP family Zn ribbon phosphoesterase